MQKKIIALAVAGLTTAAFAQTNVTIYGVADVSVEGQNIGQGKSPANKTDGAPQGSTVSLHNNSSLVGLKGTEDLGNGLKGLFQFEQGINITGSTNGTLNNSTAAPTSMRDSFVGLGSKYGTGLAGYVSTPFRSALNSFDVMPGATGDGRIEGMLGNMKMGASALNGTPSAAGATNYQASIRSTAMAYALPTMYGFNGSIAYTGNGSNTNVGSQTTTNNTLNNAFGFNLGWAGYGVDIKGAFQQAKYQNVNSGGNTVATDAANYTSYLVGVAYTGVPGLKASVVYNRNTLGTNPSANTTVGSMKGSNNALYAGVSYRFGNNEPRLAYSTVSNTSGMSSNYGGQDGARQWTANWGYYLSKRTQVYGIVSVINNAANGVYGPMNSNGYTGGTLTGGQSVTTYGAGMRTNF